MTPNRERYEDRLDGPQKSISFATRSSPTASMPATTTEDEIVADLDEPPENRTKLQVKTDFHRSTIRPSNDRQTSLLTKALLRSPDSETSRPEIRLDMDLGRRRSVNSNTSTASSMDLTSDGGLTSPARTNTPSPPFPATIHKHIASYTGGSKPTSQIVRPQVAPNHSGLPNVPASVKPESTVETLTKKRCITFACGGQKPPQQPSKPVEEKTVPTTSDNTASPQRRPCSIKFACSATVKQEAQVILPAKTAEVTRGQGSRSPVTVRKTRTAQSPRPSHRSSPSLSRRTSQSPLATRRNRPAFLTANQSSEATRFHEFASEVVEEDDWIRRDSSDNKKKITISDTLRKENAIRQLGKEAEEEALQEEEDDEQDEEDDEQDEEDDGDIEDDQSDDDDADHSDGNETDNEAGFAESDDESDGEDQFWTPGRSIKLTIVGEAINQRASPQRTTSESSIESTSRMSLPVPWSDASGQRSKVKSPRRPKIRPGTPDLPDSTDFVCGTLDEDRPLENAYVSFMEVRKRERHRAIPQDIDPSFPTSDPENEDEDEDEDENCHQNDSDEPLWIHGKFEESDEHDQTSRRSRPRKSPLHSPKRMHSPPPAKSRLRSPPPRRLFGGTSPRRMRSPFLAPQISPAASPASHPNLGAITFAPLGQRPGLTHTKSLPRTPNAFCKQYRAARLAAVNGNLDEETTDGYTRGAIDIVKGLERKRQHRKEKLLRKQNNRARKGGPERKPQPGKGAERMRELGLHMAGKGGGVKAEYILSI